MEYMIPIEMQKQQAKKEIQCCEDLNRLYGLTLTDADVADLVELRRKALRSVGRVEFGGGILPKLIRAFCSSPYVDRYNYAAVLGELQDAFYYFKTESQEQFSDDELIEFMVGVFNGEAAGSPDLLSAISLEELCRWARNSSNSPWESEEAFL